MRWCVALVVLGACGRPEIDPAPYEQACATSACPAPYVCMKADYGLVPPPFVEPLQCFVPCASDDDCGDGFACNGYREGAADLGPPVHTCFRLADAE